MADKTFTAAEVIEIANDMSDSFGNLLRIDFVREVEAVAERGYR